MMRALRDKKTMHVVLWTLVVVFVGSIFFVFGMKYTTGYKNDPNLVAKVGDTEITRSDFDRLYKPALDKLFSAKPEGPSSEETKRLQDEVLNNLVDEVILEQISQKLGINVPDEELAASIRRQPYFTDKNGNFDKEKYQQILQANQLTVEQFEASERGQLLMQKIRSVLSDGVLYTNDEVDHYASLLNRDLKAAYVSLDESAYERNIPVKEADLRDFYEKTRNQYDHPERVKIRHIYLTASSTEGFQDPEKTKKTLEEYRNQVLSGKTKFPDLAKKYSQDDSSKNQGGEIGWVDRGTLTKDMEDNIFGLKKGQVTKAFKLQNGYDLAQIEDTEKAYKSAFEEVRSKVLKQYQKQQASQRIMSLSGQLAGKLKEKEPLEKAAKELGLSVTLTDWFNREKGVPRIENSKNAAEALAGLHPQEWKGPLSIGQKEYFIQVVDAREGKSHPVLTEQQRDGLIQRMTYERQQTWFADFLSDQRKKLKVKTFLNG